MDNNYDLNDLLQEKSYSDEGQEWQQWIMALQHTAGWGPIKQRALVEALADREGSCIRCTINDELKQAITRLHGNSCFGIWEVVKRDMAQCHSRGWRIVTLWEPGYPELLRECPDAPVLLYSTREWSISGPVVSVVGTRGMTHYGKRFCEDLMGILEPYRPMVVSGFARGVDIHAQLAAIGAGIRTWAVFGHGLAHTYPKEHRQYRPRVDQNGGFLSEFRPDEPPLPMQFVRRNRIIAGMSEATIVVESDRKGGSLTTARMALDYNREVLAVPGRIGDRYSRGCNLLLSEQVASPICDLADVPKMLGWTERYANKTTDKKAEPINLTAMESAVIILLERSGPSSLSTLSGLLGIGVAELSPALLRMEVKGLICKKDPLHYEQA